MAARVVLLAGASGSGKTSLCRRLGLPVLALDDFYRDASDADEPTGDDVSAGNRDDAALPMPRRFGIVDWDDPASWHAGQALETVRTLCRDGSADVPVYDIPTSRRSGSARLDLGGASLFVAEGIFAAELVAAAAAHDLLADALCLRLHPVVTFARRLLRDLAESRKPPHVLVRRGVGLARAEPALVRRWTRLGCRPVSIAEAERTLSALTSDHARYPPH